MVTLNEAKELIKSNAKPLSDVVLPLSLATNYVLSKPVNATINVPSFDNSAMDGYAFLYDGKQNTLEVTQQIKAGSISSKILKPGEAARIFTGAAIPEGANTVVPQELVELNENTITFNQADLQKSQHVRTLGSQCKKGDTIANLGTLLTPGAIGLLASVGITEVAVTNKPTVSVIITGDELQEPGTELKNGFIYNSNLPAISSYLNTLGIDVLQHYQCNDEVELLKSTINKFLKNSDVLILSGGISVGEYDLVFDALQSLQVKTLFYKVRQKPGKPLFVGQLNDKWIFALPGNPASVLSCFNQYVKPLLLTLMGHQNSFEPTMHLPIAHQWQKKGELSHVLKARIINNKIELLEGQESFNLGSFVQADGFVLLQENQINIEPNTILPFYTW